MNNVPYAALTGVMTGDPDERTSIASWRQIFANSAGFIVQSLAIPMVGPASAAATRPRATSGPWGCSRVLGAVLFVVAFAATKERIQPDPKQKTSLGQDLGDLMKNGPWIALFLATRSTSSPSSMRGGVMLPFFKYNAGDQNLFSWFNGFGLASLLVGVAFSTKLCAAFGKRNLFLVSMVLTGILATALFVLPAHATASSSLRRFCASSRSASPVRCCGR